MHNNLLKFAAAACLALALAAPAATAHNAGASGMCGTVACRDTAVFNGCGVEVGVSANAGNPVDASELPCPQNGNSQNRFGPSHVVNGVAGRYVGASGPLVEVTGGTTTSVFPQQGLGPVEVFAVINTFCDIEVGGDGQSPDATLDETLVDTTAGGATIPNSLWDDGGVAGACHTSTYGYDNAAHTLYNTPGCPTGNYAMAEDMLLGDSVEIGVGCDNTSTAPGNSGGPDLVGAVSCVINEVILQQDTGSLNGCLLPALGCILNAGTCTDPTTLICGSDGSTDTINFGEGGARAPHGSSANFDDGVAYPAPANGCANTSGNAQVYVIAGVRVEAPDPAAVTAGTEYAAVSISLVPTVGWIDQVL
jgi:hypothetical protein